MQFLLETYPLVETAGKEAIDAGAALNKILVPLYNVDIIRLDIKHDFIMKIFINNKEL